MKRRRRGLEIPAAVARREAVPEELDSAARRPYVIPSTERRRIAGWILLGAAALVGGLVTIGGHPRLLFGGGLLAVLGVWCLLAAWPLAVSDSEALASAGRRVGFAVGHASAAVTFDGWRARPVWNVLLFNADDPPSRRALVRVDAVDGTVVGEYEEKLTAGS